MTKEKIKVLVIDDSAVIRHLLTEIIDSSGDMQVVGSAIDPIFALEKIRALAPDVITLDVEMPRMDGLSFLESLMQSDPRPVVMVSALTGRGQETTLRALELGAVDFVEKPSVDIRTGVVELGDQIVQKVRTAARARIRRRLGAIVPQVAKVELKRNGVDLSTMRTTDRIIAIGASTGGTQAITEILTGLSEQISGIVIAQHMPPQFTASFAKRLDVITRLDVREAQAGERVTRGCALVCPGGVHMEVRRDGAMYYTSLGDGPPVNFAKPSIDLMFYSVAKCAGRNAIGVLLTGMGEDGARGLLAMRQAGAFTIAQDEATSVVYGMPQKAAEYGAAQVVLPLEKIAQEILRRAL